MKPKTPKAKVGQTKKKIAGSPVKKSARKPARAAGKAAGKPAAKPAAKPAGKPAAKPAAKRRHAKPDSMMMAAAKNVGRQLTEKLDQARAAAVGAGTAAAEAAGQVGTATGKTLHQARVTAGEVVDKAGSAVASVVEYVQDHLPSVQSAAEAALKAVGAKAPRARAKKVSDTVKHPEKLLPAGAKEVLRDAKAAVGGLVDQIGEKVAEAGKAVEDLVKKSKS